MRRALIAACLLLAFLAVVLTTLPVDAAVRWALARAGVGADRVAFASARLDWRGVQLADVTLGDGAGRQLRLAWLRVRPSIAGLVTRRDGLPATMAGRACDGWLDGRIEPTAAGIRVAGVWTEMRLDDCAADLGLPGEATGRIQGRVDVTIDPAGGRHGTGVVRFGDVVWRIPGIPAHVPTRAEAGEVQWDVAGERLALRRVEIRNDELEATASGIVEIERPLAESRLALDLTVTPRPGMPQAHRDLLASLRGGPPDRRGARRFHLGGRLGAPVLEGPS